MRRVNNKVNTKAACNENTSVEVDVDHRQSDQEQKQGALWIGCWWILSVLTLIGSSAETLYSYWSQTKTNECELSTATPESSERLCSKAKMRRERDRRRAVAAMARSSDNRAKQRQDDQEAEIIQDEITLHDVNQLTRRPARNRLKYTVSSRWSGGCRRKLLRPQRLRTVQPAAQGQLASGALAVLSVVYSAQVTVGSTASSS